MPARRSDRITRGESGRIGSSMTSAPTTSPSTATNTHEEPSRLVRRRMSLARCGRGCALGHEAPLAERHVMLAHAALDARAVLLLRIDGERQRRGSRSRAARTIAVASTCGDTWSSEAASRSTSSPSKRPNTSMSAISGTPEVSVPVLSNSSTLPRAIVSSAPPPLTMMPRRAASGDPRHHRDRHRQDQRTRRRDHQHGERAGRIPAEHPRAAGDHQRHRDEDRGVPVGEPDERRLVAVRPPSPGARCRRTCSPRPWSTARRSNAGPALTAPDRTRSPIGRSSRSRLAGERRLVEHPVAQHHAVDGHDLARLDQQPVADLDIVDRPA